MPKRVVSIKIPPGQAKKLADAVALVRDQYGVLLDGWRELPESQRLGVLAHSPLLASLLRGVV